MDLLSKVEFEGRISTSFQPLLVVVLEEKDIY